MIGILLLLLLFADKLPGDATNSTVTVACRKTDGSAFATAATYEVLVRELQKPCLGL
jgi:hypothetical protein